MSAVEIKEAYREAVADAVKVRDAHIFDGGEDEDVRKAANEAFDVWNASARAKRDADLAELAEALAE